MPLIPAAGKSYLRVALSSFNPRLCVGIFNVPSLAARYHVRENQI